MELNVPAQEAAIAQAEKELGIRLPDGYRTALFLGNGGDGFVGSSYLILWRVEELKDLNQQYRVSEFMPGFLIFGSSGGGTAFGFDTRSPAMPIVQVEFVGMGWDDAIPCGNTFAEFLAQLESST